MSIIYKYIFKNKKKVHLFLCLPRYPSWLFPVGARFHHRKGMTPFLFFGYSSLNLD